MHPNRTWYLLCSIFAFASHDLVHAYVFFSCRFGCSHLFLSMYPTASGTPSATVVYTIDSMHHCTYEAIFSFSFYPTASSTPKVLLVLLWYSSSRLSLSFLLNGIEHTHVSFTYLYLRVTTDFSSCYEYNLLRLRGIPKNKFVKLARARRRHFAKKYKPLGNGVKSFRPFLIQSDSASR